MALSPAFTSLNDTVSGTPGNDHGTNRTAGNDSLDGGLGNHFISRDGLNGGASPVSVGPAGPTSGTVIKSGGIGTDTLTSIESIHATANNDSFTGSTGNDSFVDRGDEFPSVASYIDTLSKSLQS